MIAIAYKFRHRGIPAIPRLADKQGGWGFGHASRATLCVLALLILSGCTNSKLIIGPLYNRLDDQMRGEFHKLGEFNEDQIAYFEQRVGTFHVWHRQEELPQYATLLNSIQTSIRERGKTSKDDVQEWMDTAEKFSRRARLCHPVNFSYDLMQTLTDDQINFIERRFASERKKNYDRYLSSTPAERRQRRVDNVVKWAGRIGFDFTNTQIEMLDRAMSNQISMRRQYYRLVDEWAKNLFVIARQQQAPDYEEKMRTQLNKLWTLLEKAHNNEWRANRQIWRDFGDEFVQSMTSDQRIYAGTWIDKMSDTIRAISQDEPSFRSDNNPEHGCLPGSAING